MKIFLIVFSLLCICLVQIDGQRCTRHPFLPKPSFTLGKVCKETKSCSNQCKNVQKEVCTSVNEYVCTTYKRYECAIQYTCSSQRNPSNNNSYNNNSYNKGVLAKMLHGKKKFLNHVVNGIMSKVRKARCVGSKHCSGKSKASPLPPQGPSSQRIKYEWKSNPGLNTRSKNRSEHSSQKYPSTKPLPPSPPSSPRDTSRSSSNSLLPEYKKNNNNVQRSKSRFCNKRVCSYVPYREACGFKPNQSCQFIPTKECKYICNSSWTCCGTGTTITTTPRPFPQSSVPPPGPPAPPIFPGPPSPPTDFNVVVGPPAPDFGTPLDDDDEDYDYDGDFVIIEA